MFQALFELLAGRNADPSYATDVYPSVGLFTLIMSLGFAVVFYILLGRWKPIWDKLVHWLVTIVILAICASIMAVHQAKTGTGGEGDAYMYTFSVVNAFYAVLCFIIFSFLFKKASIFAKRTPF